MEETEALIETATGAEDLEVPLGTVLARLRDADVFEQVDTIRLYGWIARRGSTSLGVYLPEPLGPRVVRIEAPDPELVHEVVELLTHSPDSPLQGAEAKYRRSQSVFG